ncbi:MAG: phospholipase D-like domain-containing protein [Candidatus Baldrarchaeia archaeon]
MRRSAYYLVILVLVLILAIASYRLLTGPQAQEEIEATVICFISPDNSYSVICQLIDSANHSIFIEMYLMTNPYLVARLDHAIERGVRVIVILEGNPLGISEEYVEWVAYNLTLAGASVYWAPKEFNFMHSKFMIIDNETVVVESANWAKTGIPVDPSYGNREWGIAIKSSVVAQQFLEIFLKDLANATFYEPSGEEVYEGPSPSIPEGKYSPQFEPFEYSGKIRVKAVFSPENSEHEILDLIRSANESICIEVVYIYLHWGEEINPFVRALVDASKRGVRIRIILDIGKMDDSTEAIEYLLDNGNASNIEVRWSNSTYFETMHNKGIIVDGKVVLISSINWSESSVWKNREAGVIVYCEEIAQYYLGVFNWDWAVSVPYQPSS